MFSKPAGPALPRRAANLQCWRLVSAAVLLACAAVAMPDGAGAQTAPAKPTGFTVIDGYREIGLRWTGPDDSTITKWQYKYKLDADTSYGEWTDMEGSGPDTRRYVVTGLANNKFYDFRMRAVNNTGNSPQSSEKTGETYGFSPNKPTGLQALSGNGKVTLTWNEADYISIQGWDYRQKESSGSYGSWKPIPGSGADTTTHIIDGLENGTEYAFRIRSYNSFGSSPISGEASAIPMPAAPGKPTGFEVTPGNRKATLTWNDPGNDTITKWQYSYKTTEDYGLWIDMPGSGADTVRHVVSMLANDTLYTFRIRAVNNVGDGAESDEVSATPVASVPGKPTGLAALTGDGQITLQWTDPADATIRKWQYAYKTTSGYGSWTDMSGSGATTTGHTVGSLTNGTTYTIRIRAVNDVGDGPESDEVSATPLSVPAKPAGFAVTAGDAQVALEWDDPLNASIAKWQYSWKTTGVYGAWTDISGSGAQTTEHTVAGLANGVEHVFRIRAVNGSGNGAESEGVAATPRPPPAKPAGFRIEAGNTQARLLWTDPGNGSIAGWQYSFKTTGDYGVWTNIPGSGAATVRYTVTGLTNDTAYTFRLRAVNGSGGGAPSDEASATPRKAPPAKPTGFGAEAGDGRVVLTWDDPDDSSISGWEYNYKTSGGDYSPQWSYVPGSGASTTRHTVTGLVNGAAYTFKIRAANDANGEESDERTVTPQPPPPAKPTGLSATAGDGRAALAWDDPSNATVSKWQYAYKTTGGYGGWTDVPDSAATTTAHTVTGLANGVVHTFRIRAVNGGGEGAASDEVTVTPVLPPPAKPAGFAATAGDGQVSLSWTDPGNSSITGWQYSYKTTGEYGNWIDVPNGGATTTAYTVTGLTNGTAHTFKIRAVNASGNGVESDEAAATPIAVPAKPVGFAATPGDSEVRLAWTALGDTTVTGWQYSYKTTGEYGNWTGIAGSGATTTAHTVTGLTNGTAHTFRLRAVNASGSGAASDEATATPLAVPAKPAGFTAMPGDAQVALTWSDPSNATISKWQYAYKTTGEYGNWTDIANSGATTTAHTVIGLTNGTVHTFRLRAVNASGNGVESDEAAATPVAVPAKPAGFFATPGDGRVRLQWTNPGDATITGWQYAVKTTGAYGPWAGITGSGAETTAHTVTPLDNGTSYAFKVRAVNASGNGAESDEATATPLAVPAKPTGFTATAGDGQASLQWTDPGDATITSWQYAIKTTGAYGSWTGIPGSGAETTAYTVAPLENGESYAFKLRAVNASGNGAESDEATATLAAAPAKPTGFAATAGAGEVVLSWNDPQDSAITGWEYNQRRAGGEFEADWTFILGSGADTTGYTVPGLEIGATYGFKVRAVAGGLEGAESDEETVTLPPVPAEPAGLTATAGDRRVSLDWTALGDSTVTRWQYRYRTEGGGYGSWTDIPNGSEDAEDTTGHTVTGLAPGIPHHFRIRAVNSSGPGLESDEAAATPFAVPAKPTGFAAAAGAGEVVLSWDNPNDAAITGWKYNRKQGDGDYEEDWTAIGNSGPATTGHTVTGLETGVTYTFKVRAVAGDRLGIESDEVTATVTLPPVPARPTGLTATAGDREVALRWNGPNDPTVTGWQYKVETTGNFGDWIVIPGSGADTTAHTVTGLEYGVNYAFEVRARNAGGHSVESESATVASLPARPAGFTATPGDRQAVLEWDDPGDGTITHWEYTQRRADGEFEEGWTHIPVPVSRSGRMRYSAISLENGVAYAFKLHAVNASGEGEESAIATATPMGVPDTPTDFTATAGDGRVALRWRNPEALSVTGWQYRYRTESGNFGDWRDIQQTDVTTPAGFIGYTVAGLDNGVIYYFQVRAVGAFGAGLPSETREASPEPPKPDRPTGLKAHAGYGQVVLTWDKRTYPTNTEWEYAVWQKTEGGPNDLCDCVEIGCQSPDQHGSPSWIDILDSGATTTQYTVPDLTNRIEYAFQVRAVVGDKCSRGSNVASAIPKEPAKPAERRAVKALLASLAGHVAAGAEAVIGERFSADPAASRVVLAGREVPLFTPARNEEAHRFATGRRRATTVGMNAREALRKSAFQISLGPSAEEALPQWSLWHRGELRRFEGSDGPGLRFGGRLLSVWFGADMRWGGKWLAGTALARSEGALEYGTDASSGTVETALDSVHPYLLRRFEGGGTAWVTFGRGRGTIENETAGRDIETADAELATASAGFRAPLPAFRGLKLSASGAAGFARFEADGDARTAIGSLSASTNRQSLGVEAALEEGGAAYDASLSLRRDGGDGANGIGLELTKGVEAALPPLSGHAAVRTQWLVWNSDGEYREFGVAAAVRRPAGPNGRGLSWSLSVAQGTPDGAAGGPESFWREDAPERGGGEDAFSLDLSAGWGLVSRWGAFTPRAAFGLAGTNDRRLELGLDIGPLSGPRLKLAARRRIPRAGASESRITAAVQFRF